MEKVISESQAREIVNAPHADAYGTTRIYAIWRGQIVAVKSEYHIDKYAPEAERFYTVTRKGVPIRKA